MKKEKGNQITTGRARARIVDPEKKEKKKIAAHCESSGVSLSEAGGSHVEAAISLGKEERAGRGGCSALGPTRAARRYKASRLA